MCILIINSCNFIQQSYLLLFLFLFCIKRWNGVWRDKKKNGEDVEEDGNRLKWTIENVNCKNVNCEKLNHPR